MRSAQKTSVPGEANVYPATVGAEVAPPWRCAACGAADVLFGICLFLDSCAGSAPEPERSEEVVGPSPA